MNVTNLTIQGGVFARGLCRRSWLGSSSPMPVEQSPTSTVLDITQTSGCVIGNGIRVNAVVAGTPRTVTITDAIVTGFNRSGLLAQRAVRPCMCPAARSVLAICLPPGLNAQNAVQIGVRRRRRHLHGQHRGRSSGLGAPGRPGTVATRPAMLLFSASNLTISDNTITGADTDIGICRRSADQHQHHHREQCDQARRSWDPPIHPSASE